ncbi:unknown [Bacteroides sp. CAG:633]|nr:unknown [Bacteroides sp. CAG:633]
MRTCSQLIQLNMIKVFHSFIWDVYHSSPIISMPPDLHILHQLLLSFLNSLFHLTFGLGKRTVGQRNLIHRRKEQSRSATGRNFLPISCIIATSEQRMHTPALVSASSLLWRRVVFITHLFFKMGKNLYTRRTGTARMKLPDIRNRGLDIYNIHLHIIGSESCQ